MAIVVRCKQCGTELTSTSKVQCCGCPNMMKVVDDKVGANNLDLVVLLQTNKIIKKTSVLSPNDLKYQEERRKRKVRKLDFEER